MNEGEPVEVAGEGKGQREQRGEDEEGGADVGDGGEFLSAAREEDALQTQQEDDRHVVYHRSKVGRLHRNLKGSKARSGQVR